MKRLILAAAVAAILTGCMSSGVLVDDNKVAAFKPGVTTREQVIAALGPPTEQTTQPDGTTTIGYTYIEAKARPATYIPLVGAFAGGADGTSNNVTFRFTKAGKLLNTTKTSSNSGTGMGLAGSEDNRRK